MHQFMWEATKPLERTKAYSVLGSQADKTKHDLELNRKGQRKQTDFGSLMIIGN